MTRHIYPAGFREEFIQEMKDRRAPHCRMCNRPQRPIFNFATCPRCGLLICSHCQVIHKPERHDWKPGDPTQLKKCEMCAEPSEDLAPCTFCLYMLCPLCRSRHKPEQHKGNGKAVALSAEHTNEIAQRMVARVGVPPHGEPPLWPHQFVPDCPDCRTWHEKLKSAYPEVSKLYLEEQEKVSKEWDKEIMDDLGISEEEMGGPL
jgi:hypothetical protein